ncbi:putative peptidyl-prolyl cis-trans isomerase [Tsukamurella pulmonis]|uniref:Peptidyl-prolyl cis-trans isomerase B (Cyclophilin B) n=1 Tax=Tsukamurella pulmonis TaxID=47312 RepID=A0A1H1EI50_9ACTN|nr:peptidylprolyl isomerase [Tsukamurella pulmonis]KXO91931.1 hypothetical protein AXK56_02125 [Tsukamurella pulmonis]KXP09581.1 hypothetical protein AXK57_11970 [Tsukamurella pulmonis]RDH09535.1 hypothetical protein DVB88_22595 [Tsukamurella pulmonis]SDQ88304.1 peptidyl-prolyl cis-trans isomerase B (cyclophilin B) [Tsukamurella pulmonis]SUP20859.1 Putative bifunctional phosphatase/peptidyl-prolyl cis-trans isomerase [Tsukamurella pulmonis]
MPSNEERRQAAREKLAKQNERRETDARKRKVKAIGAGVAVVAVAAAVAAYIWVPAGPRAPLRVAAENKYNSLHVTCDFGDRDPAADARKSIASQKQQIAEMRTQIADARKRVPTMPADQRAPLEEQITAAAERADSGERLIGEAEKQLPKLDQLAERNKSLTKPEGKDIPNTGTMTGTITTNAGPIGFELDRSKAPCNVETFATLMQAKYFDGTSCHRETANEAADKKSGLFVLQCGDPSGTGLGGPSWTSPDEAPGFLEPAPGQSNPMQPSQNVIYPAGTIAVANANQQPNPQTGDPGTSNTGSSQFFLVYKDTTLPANYSVIGKTDDAGLTVLQQIAKKGIVPKEGDPAPKPGEPVTDGKPKEPVNIATMKLDE